MTETYHSKRHPTLRLFSRGEAVARLQRLLQQHLADLTATNFVDALFGMETARQLRRFQQQAGLTVDGVAGAQSWQALLAQPAPATAAPSKNAGAGSGVGGGVGGGVSGSMSADLQRLQRGLKKLGYQYFDDGQPYHLNIVGIRNPSTRIDQFDDELWLSYRDEQHRWQLHQFSMTTDPGKTYTQDRLLNSAGAAILQPGQYVEVYQIARHQNKYEALCQKAGPVKVWRDNNRDNQLDRSGQTYQGYFGINIHRAGNVSSSQVGAYSAGCQVLQRASDFNLLMELAKKSQQLRLNKFSYTLLQQQDL